MISANKFKIAFFDFTGCEGCQLSAVDSLQTHPELLEVVEIVQFREAISEKRDDYQIAFVEGSCSRPEEEARLKTIREQAEIVIALGACAHIGGVNTIRNWQSQDQAQRYVYGEAGKLYANYSARPIDAVIPIDSFIPGCPIDRQEFTRAIKALLQNRQPVIPDYPVCIECKLKENVCVFLGGQACLGSITRAGCGALCPTFGASCDGCRGMISNPNFGGLKLAFTQYGYDERDLTEKMRLFHSYHLNGIVSSNVA